MSDLTQGSAGAARAPPALLAFRIAALMDYLEGGERWSKVATKSRTMKRVLARAEKVDALRLEGMYRVAGPRGELDALYAALVAPKNIFKVACILGRAPEFKLSSLTEAHAARAAAYEVERMLKAAGCTTAFHSHCVTGAIKRALRKCTPILTFSMHDVFVQSAHAARTTGDQGKRALRECALQLPPTSRWLLLRCLAHIDAVLARGDDNRMTPESIAITLGSNILRDEGAMMPNAINCELVTSELMALHLNSDAVLGEATTRRSPAPVAQACAGHFAIGGRDRRRASIRPSVPDRALARVPIRTLRVHRARSSLQRASVKVAPHGKGAARPSTWRSACGSEDSGAIAVAEAAAAAAHAKKEREAARLARWKMRNTGTAPDLSPAKPGRKTAPTKQANSRGLRSKRESEGDMAAAAAAVASRATRLRSSSSTSVPVAVSTAVKTAKTTKKKPGHVERKSHVKQEASAAASAATAVAAAAVVKKKKKKKRLSAMALEAAAAVVKKKKKKKKKKRLSAMALEEREVHEEGEAPPAYSEADSASVSAEEWQEVVEDDGTEWGHSYLWNEQSGATRWLRPVGAADNDATWQVRVALPSASHSTQFSPILNIQCSRSIAIEQQVRSNYPISLRTRFSHSFAIGPVGCVPRHYVIGGACRLLPQRANGRDVVGGAAASAPRSDAPRVRRRGGGQRPRVRRGGRRHVGRVRRRRRRDDAYGTRRL
jgi:hypothetical protein